MSENRNEFQGDILIKSTPDGADIVLEDGLIQDCRGFETAIFLSLFGGNEKDLNKKTNETWWGNLVEGTKENEWIHSELNAMVKGLPITSGNIKKARDAAQRDLSWIKDDAGADEINIFLHAENPTKTKLTAEILKNNSKINTSEYEFQWKGAEN